MAVSVENQKRAILYVMRVCSVKDNGLEPFTSCMPFTKPFFVGCRWNPRKTAQIHTEQGAAGSDELSPSFTFLRRSSLNWWSRKASREGKNLPRRLIAKFYRAQDGTEPVNGLIKEQNVSVQLAIDRQIDRMNSLDEEHPHLVFPHSSQIEGELRELRCHYGRTPYRILYRRSKQFVILLHIFEKHVGPVPEAEKQIARDKWDDFRKRMNTKFRTRPGPIGKKAPLKRRP